MFLFCLKKALNEKVPHPSNKTIKRPKIDLENVNKNSSTYILSKGKK